MMRKKREQLLVYCVLACMLLLPVSAQVIISPQASAGGDVGITFSPIKDSIMQGEEALFKLVVHNPTLNDNDLDFYFVTDYIGKFSPMTDPLYYMTTGIHLEPDETTSFILKLKSDDNLTVGVHKIILGLKSEQTGEKSEILLNVKVSKEIPKYAPDVTLTISTPSYVDISKKFSLKANLKNNNPLHIPNLLVTMNSPLFSKESYVELEPDDSKTVEFTLDLKGTKPQKIQVTASAVVGNETLSTDKKMMEILPFLPSFALSSKTKKGVVSETTSINVTNNANVDKTEKVNFVAGKFMKYLTKTDPVAGMVKKNGVEVYEWELTLGPNETTVLYVKTSYMVPVVIILLILLAVLYYYVMKDPVVVIKNAHNISRSGGAVNSVKVMVVVKNRRNKTIKDVRVIDRVNELVNFEMPKGPGVMKPAKVYSHAKEGKIIEWSLEELDPYEERILIYEIRPKLSIIGNIRLEPVLVKYKYDKHEMKTYSNVLSIES